jgi:hypothetical protein
MTNKVCWPQKCRQERKGLCFFSFNTTMANKEKKLNTMATREVEIFWWPIRNHDFFRLMATKEFFRCCKSGIIIKNLPWLCFRLIRRVSDKSNFNYAITYTIIDMTLSRDAKILSFTIGLVLIAALLIVPIQLCSLVV